VKLPPNERRLIIAATLYRQRYERGPSWAELAQALKLSKAEIGATAWLLRRNPLVSFTSQQRSLKVTRAGLVAALGKGAGQP
jgi:hypothetical protein